MKQGLSYQAVPGWQTYLKASRPMFLTASILPMLVGTALAYTQTLTFDTLSFLLALLCVACVHLAINVLNDVYDELNGTDRVNTDRISPFTGGSRAIQDNLITLTQMRQFGLGLLAISLAPALFLMYLKGPGVLLFGLAAILIGYAYSAPPLKLASRGLGEFAVASGFGVVTVIGAVWLQQGTITQSTVWLGIATGLWVANILLINEVPDVSADEQAGKHTLVVRFGYPFTAVIYAGNNVAAAFLVFLAVRETVLPISALIMPLISVLAGIYASYTIYNWQTRRTLLVSGIKLTLAIHALNCLWLLALFLI